MTARKQTTIADRERQQPTRSKHKRAGLSVTIYPGRARTMLAKAPNTAPDLPAMEDRHCRKPAGAQATTRSR